MRTEVPFVGTSVVGMMLDMRRVTVVADIFFSRRNSSAEEDEIVHCRCSRAFAQWVCLIELMVVDIVILKLNSTTEWSTERWKCEVLISPLLSRDRELYRSDNRLIFDLSDTAVQGQFYFMFTLANVRWPIDTPQPKKQYNSSKQKRAIVEHTVKDVDVSWGH